MASDLDWSQCPVVESIPGKVSAAWVFRGTRVPVSALFENLKTSPIEEILENFHVTRDQVQDGSGLRRQKHTNSAGTRAWRIKILDESVRQNCHDVVSGLVRAEERGAVGSSGRIWLRFVHDSGSGVDLSAESHRPKMAVLVLSTNNREFIKAGVTEIK